ncbi:MAG: helix-turn-helix domain-containing protein [bacterium]|nr:helix-turn-helix domain-containing protein [bacterium]
MLLDAKAVGEQLSLSVWGVKNLHRTGQLPGVIVARKLRFKVADVARFVEGLTSA